MSDAVVKKIFTPLKPPETELSRNDAVLSPLDVLGAQDSARLPQGMVYDDDPKSYKNGQKSAKVDPLVHARFLSVLPAHEINSRSLNGATLLFHAAERDGTHILLSEILKHKDLKGSTINARTCSGSSAFEILLESAQYSCCVAMLRHELFDVNTVNQKGDTLLTLILSTQNQTAVEKVLPVVLFVTMSLERLSLTSFRHMHPNLDHTSEKIVSEKMCESR